MSARQVAFSIHPDLLSKQLGSDMYRAPDALKQLVANALDSGATQVDLRIHYNELDAPDRATISDNGRGILPSEMDDAFGEVGVHKGRATSPRETIGSRGIGRFAVHSLAAESRWETRARDGGATVVQRWTMTPGQRGVSVTQGQADSADPGTLIDMTLQPRDDVIRLFASEKSVKRTLFNAFAGYLARYGDQVTIRVNGTPVLLEEYVDERESEAIPATSDSPAAEMHHMVLNQQVEQPAPTLLIFAAYGATISQDVLAEESVPSRKYLGIVDSAELSDLTNTSKTQLPEFDSRFQGLKREATARARAYIRSRQGNKAKEFLEKARLAPYYPYRTPPKTPVDRYRRQLYDGVLLTLEETYGIGSASARQQELIFNMTRQLLQSEDLASVLTSVLGLKGDEVARFAALLRSTSLASIIAVADLLVDRLRFIEELHELVYGAPAKHVRERKHLHKILEGHSWLFGEQFHLMGSDRRMDKLLPEVAAKLGLKNEDEETVSVDTPLLDIPDLYFARTKWLEGARFHQHLIVELKRPSVRLSLAHVQQLQRYAAEVVESSEWGQKSESHRFHFVLVSSDISDAVMKSYQDAEEPGFLSRPKLAHPTELWALRWSDYLDRRREELHFLQQEMEITAEPELLEYLKERVGEYLPAAMHEVKI